MQHDFYWLFSAYWWLLFPLLWLLAAGVKLWSRHLRAQRALDVIQACVEKGKEPPEEVLQVLRSADQSHRKEGHGQGYEGYGWIPVFLFAAIAVGLVLFAFLPGDRDMQHIAAFLFAAIVMTGLSIGNAVVMLNRRRHQQDRNLPR